MYYAFKESWAWWYKSHSDTHRPPCWTFGVGCLMEWVWACWWCHSKHILFCCTFILLLYFHFLSFISGSLEISTEIAVCDFQWSTLHYLILRNYLFHVFFAYCHLDWPLSTAAFYNRLPTCRHSRIALTWPPAPGYQRYIQGSLGYLGSPISCHHTWWSSGQWDTRWYRSSVSS